MLDTILNTLISPAYADTAAAPAQAGGSSIQLFVMLGVFVLFMYFAIWRPQSKRAKDHRTLINSLTKGDEVVTAGGIIGRVSKIVDQYIVLALGENVEIMVQKSSIASALPKGTMESFQ